MRTLSIALFSIALALATGCEAETSDVSDGGEDASPDVVAVDSAVDAAIAYPAPHPAEPTIVDMGGTILASPRVVPIVFENDPLLATIGAFTKALHGSQYWKATTSEYGVGDLDVADPVVVPATDTVPAANITDVDVQSFLATHLDGTHAGFGAPDASTIYAVFYPAGTTITKSDGASCGTWGGYHQQVPLGATHVAYAVVPRCASFDSLSGADAVTAAASHELIEAATDPFESTKPAYALPDNDHIAYGFYPDSELADMCATDGDSFFAPADVGFMVQRSWSNTLAAAGGSPCAPIPPNNVYWAASPVLPETVNVDLTSFQLGVVATRGVTVPVGQSKTIEVDVFSTGPTETLKLIAFDLPTLQSQPAELAFTFDQETAANGDKRELTIKRLSNEPTYAGTAFVILTYTDTSHSHPTVGFAAQ